MLEGPSVSIEVTRRTASSYHRAMLECPDARRLEFELPLELAAPRAGETLVDFPGGGGYLTPYLQMLSPRTRYRVVEHVAGYESDSGDLLGGNWQRLPFAANDVDIVLTLAALHHVLEGREIFYRECHRVLSARGRLVIADVAENTPPARFLDDFVGSQSSQGHTARFMSRAAEPAGIERCGFAVSTYDVRPFHWYFPDRSTAVRFARGLFRLDRASDETIWQGLNDYLGMESRDGGLAMNWQLALIRAERL